MMNEATDRDKLAYQNGLNLISHGAAKFGNELQEASEADKMAKMAQDFKDRLA
jgi:hypothetical protein